MTIIQADVLEWAKNYRGPKMHALLADPPYHLTSITDRFGKAGSAPAQHGSDGAFQRASRGFMNATWDGVGPNGIGIAFDPETWAAMAEHLYPGAWGMAFAGSRGWHRMAVAIEDAGLIMQPTIFGWGYGSGFPKATNISAAIDARAFRAWLDLHPIEQAAIQTARLAERAARKAKDADATKETRATLKALTVAYKALAGLLPEKIGTKKHQPKFAAAELGYREKDNGYNSRERDTFDVMGCATEAATYWLGHRYGGQALKPALEPIIVFQKPYDGSPLDRITTTGAGALWIDGGRIGTDEMLCTSSTGDLVSSNGSMSGGNYGRIPTGTVTGRWPANLILSHSPACNGTCAPGCPVARLGAQSGERISGTQGQNTPRMIGGSTDIHGVRSTVDHDDTGTAARFFYQADYMYERLELADAIQYVAKASRAEREAGLDPKQTALMRLLDDSEDWEDFEEEEGRISVQPRDKSVGSCPIHGTNKAAGGRYGCGCAIIRGFAETTVDDGRAVPIDNPFQRGAPTRRNTHPTIKPIGLCRYLATLLLPPPQYGPRRLLVPFSGAASEVIGADLAGWEEVTGVELGADHVAIANTRRAYWQQRRWELGDPARKLSVKAAAKVQKGQVDMFDQPVAVAAPVPTFHEWYHGHDGRPGTKDYGGSREEYDRLYCTEEEYNQLYRTESEAAA